MSATQQLKDAFIESLGIHASSDFSSLAYGSTTGWDSVAHLALVAHVESRFDIMLTTDDVIAMSSFNKAKDILGKYGISFGSKGKVAFVTGSTRDIGLATVRTLAQYGATVILNGRANQEAIDQQAEELHTEFNVPVVRNHV